VFSAPLLVTRWIAVRLESYSGLYLERSGRNEMCAAKRRFEVIQSVLVCQVDDRESERHLRTLSAQKVVSTGTEIENMTRGDPRRIGVVILSPIRRNPHP
jgi:hypothetical protein